MDEAALIDQAKRGDERSFAQLIEHNLPALRGVVFRMIGHPDDAADLIQDAQVKAFTKLSSFRGESKFGTWLISIAVRLCLDHLRAEKRWRPYAQKYAERECASVPELRQEILNTVADPAFSFDVREHIAFCFTCVGRSLPPMQEAAIVLREVMGYSNREAARVLDITESVLRHHLAAARAEMKKTYDGLCALVNKQGICHQCSGFRNTSPEGRRGPEVEPIRADDDPAHVAGESDAAEARFRVRLRVVRDHEFADGASRSLHDLIFDRIRRIERANASR